MVINVTYISTKLTGKFVPHGDGYRLWMTDHCQWFPTVGWCPHLKAIAGECPDCGLVLDE